MSTHQSGAVHLRLRCGERRGGYTVVTRRLHGGYTARFHLRLRCGVRRGVRRRLLLRIKLQVL